MTLTYLLVTGFHENIFSSSLTIAEKVVKGTYSSSKVLRVRGRRGICSGVAACQENSTDGAIYVWGLLRRGRVADGIRSR